MKKNKLPSLVTILILTLITVLMWVGLSIYRAFTLSPEPTIPADILATFTPTLDTDTINKVESSLFFNESQIPQTNISSSPSPIASPTPAPAIFPTASPAETPTETPTATPEATP